MKPRLSKVVLTCVYDWLKVVFIADRVPMSEFGGSLLIGFFVRNNSLFGSSFLMSDGQSGKLPWFPFYAQDFMNGVRMLSPGERGVYIELLCIQWDKGRVKPSLSDALATLYRGLSDACLVTSVLEQKFVRDDDGWYNVRLDEIRRERLEKREKLQNAGRKGGKKSRKPRLSHPKATPCLNQAEARKNQNQNQNQSNKTPKPPLGSGGSSVADSVESSVAGDQAFDSWWSRYPNKQGKADAKRKFSKMSQKSRDQLELATENYIRAVTSGANGGKYCHGSTFINSRYSDWVDPDPAMIQAATGTAGVSATDQAFDQLDELQQVFESTSARITDGSDMGEFHE